MNIGGIFGPGGTLEKQLAGYSSRPGQLEMAECIAKAIAGGGITVLEGGTGLGKTYAYLVPLLLSGAKAVVSTGTKNLQDQLFRKDLPALTHALGVHPKVHVLKGRANYLCKVRFERLRAEPDLLDADFDWEPIEEFARTTPDGNLDTLPAAAASPRLRMSLASTPENCPVGECEHFNSCHFYAARRAAMKAQINVVNHHLYLSDFSLREEERGEILPSPDVVVFDEAHRLPETAVQCFGRTVSSQKIARDFHSLLKELASAKPECGVVPDLKEAARAHDEMLALMQGSRAVRNSDPLGADDLCADPQVDGAIASFCEWIERMAGRIAAIEDLPLDLKAMSNSLQEAGSHLRAWARGETPDEDGAPAHPQARWARVGDKGVMFTNAPIDVGGILGKHFAESKGACIFTSASLSVENSLDAFGSEIGVTKAAQHIWPSPFPYKECSVLLVPEDMPAPRGGSSEEHAKRVVDVICELGEANGGRAFALFTSRRAMHLAGVRLRKRLGRKGISVLAQGGRESNAQLLEQFRSGGRSILVGSHSFSMGIDIKGTELSLVVFDKLPFLPPNDPLMRAREALCRERGEDPFWRLQVPHAALCLKQAAGRLIRDEKDRGVFVLCDPRLTTAGYGPAILESLPPMRFTRSMEDARRMLETVG